MQDQVNTGSFLIHFVSRERAKLLLHRSLYDREMAVAVPGLMRMRDTAFTDDQLRQLEQTQLNRNVAGLIAREYPHLKDD